MLAILKHAKNFVAVPHQGKPMFEGIHFDGQRAMVTNTHLIVIANNFPSEKKTIHWKTNTVIEGNWPDLTKIIPEKCDTSFDFIDLKEWIRVSKIAMAVAFDQEPTNRCRLDIKGDFATLSAVGLESKFEANLTIVKPKGSLSSIAFNAKYLHDILVFFKDSDVNIVTMGFNTALSPMKLTTDKEVLAVLTPVRAEV